MSAVLIVFIVSLIICCVTAVMLGMFWFSDVRNRQHLSFFVLGGMVFIWTLFNAITMITSETYFPVIYTIRMVFVCIIPFSAAWFILVFAMSPLIEKKPVRVILFALPTIDIILLVTNPLHNLYLTDYSQPIPGRGPIFWAHTGIDFLIVIIAFIILIHFIIKNSRKNPVLVLSGVAMLIPYALNVMFSFRLIPFEHDVTPIGFFFTILILVYVSYKTNLLNIKTNLFSSTMDSIEDLILLFNHNFMLADYNVIAKKTFDEFALKTGRTQFDTFIKYLKDNTANEETLAMLDSLKTSQSVTGEYSLNVSKNVEKTFYITWHSIYLRKRLSGYILILSDVSEYMEMINEINEKNTRLISLKEEAEEASRAKGDFLSKMSHEMRTPMNAIIGITQMALKNKKLPPNYREHFKKIDGASNHLLGVINDVLDMSKIEAGEFSLYEESFSIKELLRDVFVISDIQAKKKSQKLVIKTGKDLPDGIHTDRQRLMQLIINLISNAFKFSPEKGKVELSIDLLEKKNDDILLRFEITDKGIGMTEEQIKKLFKPFVQADGSTSRNYGGTGLGLAISKSIVELMDGEIRVESTPGEGSSFIFTIKAKVADLTLEPEVDIETHIKNTVPEFKNKFEVLVADDIEINREIIMSLLSDSGIDFDIAENGRIAADKFLADPDRYKLIFMDIQMPVVDGFEATRIIRADDSPSSKTVPIIAMTANAFQEDIEACLEAGMDDHLAKPIDIDKVYKVIWKYCKDN